MKHLLLLFSFPLLLISCKKESLNDLSRKIAGKWEYEQFSVYSSTNVYPPGNGRILHIRTNGTYEEKKNDSFIQKGTFVLKRKKDCPSETNGVLFIRNNEDADFAKLIDVRNNKLTLSTSSCLIDGGVTIYRRIGN